MTTLEPPPTPLSFMVLIIVTPLPTTRKSEFSAKMSKSQAKKMDALKELATKLKDKEDCPVQLWNDAGFPGPKRLKDVEQAIVQLRKSFSKEAKDEMAKEEEAEAAKLGMTLEEYKESLKEDKRGDMQQDKRKVDDRNKDGRAKKELNSRLANGEFDMQVDYVGGDD